MDLAHLDWPFFDPLHRTLAERAVRFDCGPLLREGDIDRRCRSLVRALGESGLLRYCVPEAHGGALPALDSRALCVVREALAYRDGLTDFAFAMQGLGSGVFEIALPYRGNAYRAVYAVQIGEDIWVIHAFQKKSTRGIATPKRHLELIRQRLKWAQEESVARLKERTASS